MSKKVLRSGASIIVYDDRSVSQISPAHFTAAHWPEAAVVPGYAGGRGATLMIRHQDADWVLKHYHRGGLIGRWLDDGFPWFGLERSRSVREYNLLAAMQAAGLPAPEPVAAHCRRFGVFYTADLITRRIPRVEPLSTRLQRGPAAPVIWQAVGRCIARFHAAGFDHADLSAHNLQIDSDDAVYLLDWDRGARRAPGAWRQGNLARLQRSCRKISRDGKACFVPADWDTLVTAYEAALQP